jgi:hypothetical protein
MIYLALGLIMVMGAAVVIWYQPRLHPLARLALAYPVGLGTITLVMFWLGIAGLSFRPPILIPVLVIASALSFIVAARRGRWQSLAREAMESFRGWGAVFQLAGLIAFFILTADVLPEMFQRALVLPAIYGPDVLSRQSAPVEFANQGTIQIDGYPLMQISHPEYPLLAHLALTFVYLLQPPPITIFSAPAMILFPPLLLSMALFFFFQVGRGWKATIFALLGVLILTRTPYLIWMGSVYSLHIPATTYAFLSCLLIYQWWEEKQPPQTLWLAGMCLGFFAWCRIEGLMFGVFILALVALLGLRGLMQGRAAPGLYFFVPYMLIAYQWEFYRRFRWGEFGRLVMVSGSALILIAASFSLIAAYLLFKQVGVRFRWGRWLARNAGLIVIPLSVIAVLGATLYFVNTDRRDTLERLHILNRNFNHNEWAYLGNLVFLVPFLFRRAIRHWYLLAIPLWFILAWIMIYAWDVTNTWPNPANLSGGFASANRTLLYLYPLLLFAVAKLLAADAPVNEEAPQTVAEGRRPAPHES